MFRRLLEVVGEPAYRKPRVSPIMTISRMPAAIAWHYFCENVHRGGDVQFRSCGTTGAEHIVANGARLG
jgi:hypothetical protein